MVTGQQFIDAQSRPALIVALDEIGEQVRFHVANLFGGVNPSLLDSVGVIQVASSDFDNAHAYSVTGGAIPAYANVPDVGPLPKLIAAEIGAIQGSYSLNRARGADFVVSERRAQVFIVGDANTPATIARIEETVRLVIRQAFGSAIDVPVYYILCKIPRIEETLAPPADPQPHTMNDITARDIPNFIYVFHRVSTSGTVFTMGEVHYAMAEALFALIATAIWSSPIASRMTQAGPGITSYDDHIGTLSASMARFPRSELRTYFSNTEGERIMRGWSPGNAAIPPQTAAKLRDNAQRSVGEIVGWMRDSEPRHPSYPRRVYFQPSLRVLLQRIARTPDHPNYQQAYERWRREGRTLFDLFNVQQMEAALDDGATFEQFVQEIGEKATTRLSEWEQHSRKAWIYAQEITVKDLQQYIVSLWLDDDASGITQARDYVAALEDDVSDMARFFTNERIRHRDEFYKGPRRGGGNRQRNDRDSLAYFSALANDQRWAELARRSTIVGPGGGPASASPQYPNQGNRMSSGSGMGTSGAGGTAPGPIVGGGGGPPPPRPPRNRMPPDILMISNLLHARATWYENLIPAATTLFGLGVMAVPALTLMLLTLLPASLLSGAALAPLAVLAVVAVLFTAGAFLLHQVQRGKARQAQRDCLRFLARYYAYQCSKIEDQHRLLVTGPVQRLSHKMRDRLENIEVFFNAVATNMLKTAQQTQSDIFHGPAAGHDVLIANGLPIGEEHNTLDDLMIAVNRRRTAASSIEALRQRLLIRLRQQRDTILDMDPKQFQTHVQAVAEEVIAPLLDQLGGLGQALASPDVQQSLLRRSEQCLLPVYGGMQNTQAFICGRESHRRMIPHPLQAIDVETRHDDWVLVARIFQGSDSSDLSLGELFPYRAQSASRS